LVSSFIGQHYANSLPTADQDQPHWPTRYRAIPMYRPGTQQKQLYYNFIGAPSPQPPMPEPHQHYLHQVAHQSQLADLEALASHEMSLSASSEVLMQPPRPRKHSRGKSIDAGLSQGENKQRHNDSERRRRNKINQLLEELRTIVPNCKMNKSAILEATTDYINKLKAQSAQLAALNRDLEQENAEMLGFITKSPPPLPNLGNSSTTSTSPFPFHHMPPILPSSFFPNLPTGMEFSGTSDRNLSEEGASGSQKMKNNFMG